MTFQELQLMPSLLTTLHKEGYVEPSPIQAQAIPFVLEGRDVLASAQTGTGKTAAFALPIIQRLLQGPRSSHPRTIKALILAPTRELAEQIKDSINTYSTNMSLKTAVIYGGVSQRNQEIVLKNGVDVLIATPGRLMDLMSQRLVNLKHIEYFVLDEADRMLDMGFIRDVRKIVTAIPAKRQTMLFSATMPQDILALANELLTHPIRIEVTPPEAMIDAIQQSLYFVGKKQKSRLLMHLLTNHALHSVLVFTRTKHGANKLVKELLASSIKADAIHGNKSQSARLQALRGFKAGTLRVLVATDIAARGIDIDDLSHVINYDLPETAETYVHRMGRTGRAGRLGEAYSFCSEEETPLLTQIEKLMKVKIPLIEDHPFHVSITPVAGVAPTPVAKRQRRRSRHPQRTSRPSVASKG
jgi:ATP-dependent RNA helicase RhlE